MSEKKYDVVCFGEILWDILEDKELPGGAPVNVAYHLTRLDKKAPVISRVGNDERGRLLREVFEKRGIDTSLLQTDPKYPTGTVMATRNKAGDMQYDIVENVAWDYIDPNPENAAVISNAEFLVYGSLAAREKTSRNTLFDLLELPVKKVMDINLRPPFYTKDIVEHELRKAQVVKMNEEELETVMGWYRSYRQLEDKMKFLQDNYKINTLIVTRGSNGAMINDSGQFFAHPGYRVEVADTIGSGDSFLAGFISKYIETRNTEISLLFASAVGSYVATQHGGSPEYTMGDIVSFMYTAKVKDFIS